MLQHTRFSCRLWILVAWIAAGLLCFRFLLANNHLSSFKDTDHKHNLTEDTPDTRLLNGTVDYFAHEHSVLWNDPATIPETHTLTHIPGFAMLQNVYSINGTLILVSDHATSLPNPKHVLSAWAEVPDRKIYLVEEPTNRRIRVVDRRTAIHLLGLSARRLHGTTWLFNGLLAYIDDSSIFKVLRTHHMLESTLPSGSKFLPPTRVLFPHIPIKQQNALPGLTTVFRSLFPSIGIGFKEDWHDYALYDRPIVFETLVLLDSAAASRNPRISKDPRQMALQLEIGSPLSAFTPLSNTWWTPWRERMAEMVGQVEGASNHPIITYIFSASDRHGQLDSTTHKSLIDALKALEGSKGLKINVLDADSANHMDRLRLALSTSILFGPTGRSLMDVMWMPVTKQATVIELFPDDYLSARQYQVAKAAGVNYQAWRDSQIITLPAFTNQTDLDLTKSNLQRPMDLKNALEVPIKLDIDKFVQHLVACVEAG